MEEEKDTFEITFKGFWGRLFCKHETKHIGDLVVYHGDENAHPIHKYFRFICTKCGKIIKFKRF